MGVDDEFYRRVRTRKLGDIQDRQKGDDEEGDDTLLLKDLVRPSRGGTFTLHTKGRAVDDQDEELTEDDGDAEDEEGMDNPASQTAENGNEDGMSMTGSESQKSDGKSGEDGDAEAKRKSSSSPQPNTS
jgi:hypothetical protein